MSWLWSGDGQPDRDRIDFITDDLAVGNLGAAVDFQALDRLGIQAIVDASNRDGNPRHPGIHYHEVRIDDPDERLCEFLPKLMAFIDDERRHGPVLLHCVAGISRSPSLAICYLHERRGLSLPAALDRVCSRRVQASPHPVFLRLIQEYYCAHFEAAPGHSSTFSRDWEGRGP